MAVIVPFESPSNASIDAWSGSSPPTWSGSTPRSCRGRFGSHDDSRSRHHLISSGGKRLRPMLTLAMANLTGYSGDGHIKLAASVEFMHTATLLHDDVVRRERTAPRQAVGADAVGDEASVLVGDFLSARPFA